MKTIHRIFVTVIGLMAVTSLWAGCPPTPTSYCVQLPAGYVTFANHLAPAHLSTFLAVPPFTTVHRYRNGIGFSSYVYDPDLGGWDPEDPVIGHGEGIFIGSPSGAGSSQSIVGPYQAPSLPLTLAPGLHLLGRQEVGLGTFENITGYSPGGCLGVELYRLIQTGIGNVFDLLSNPAAYVKYTYNGTAWSPAAPVLNVGEAVWINVISPCSGALTFSANAVSPSVVGDCGTATIQVIGSAFQVSTTVKLKKSGQTDITATTVTPQAGGFTLDATFNYSGALPGIWDVEVTDPSSAVQTIVGALTITAGPDLSAASPASAPQCDSVNISAFGSAICPGATLKLVKAGETDRVGSAVTVSQYGWQISANFNLNGAAVGAWDLVVANPSGATDTLVGGVTVVAPSLRAVSPNLGGSCGTITLTASGSDLCSVSAFKLVKSGEADRNGTGVALNAAGTAASATFNLSGAPLGSVWDVVLMDSSGGVLTLPGAFSIQAPQILGITQNHAVNCAAVTLIIQGHGLCPGGSVELVRAGQPNIVGSSLTVNAAQSELSATFNLLLAQAGTWHVVVTDAGGGVTAVPGTLTVSPLALSAVVPNRGGNCSPARLNIGGTGLQSVTVKLVRAGQTDITGTVSQRSGDGLAMEAWFDLNGAALGMWDVVVTDPGCGSVTLPAAFTVDPVAISLIQPVVGKECLTVGVNISGNCFAVGATVKLKKSGSSAITGVSSVLNAGQISTVFYLAGAATGAWDIEVTNPNGDTTTLPGAFTVLPCTGCDVDVTMSGPSRVGVGRQNTFSICYANHGGTTLNNVDISVTDIPEDAQIALVSGSPVATIASPSGQPQTISFTVPSLTAGQQACYYFRLTIPTVRPPIQLTGNVSSPCANTDISQCEVVASQDPNDKTGLPGSGANHFITGSETLAYNIHFENTVSATAPAQEVFISDYVDPSRLDLSTFSLGTVSFGSHSVSAPPGLTSWTTYVPYAVNGNAADDILVKVECALVTNLIQPVYGRLTWALRSIDPVTGLRPADPLRGFLPPNITPSQGEGTVTYDVKPKPALVTGDVIGASASITFDLNSPIRTPVWVNVIDKTPPQSSVNGLAPMHFTLSFPVSWSGTDAGSGVASYDVFVSDNDGPFHAWFTGTTATSGNYTGLADHTYRFYSVAKDLVGLVESSPASPDAVTTVVLPDPIVITCPPDITTDICSSSIALGFPDPTVTGGAFDNCVPPSGSPFMPGATPVVCTATNIGATNTCTFIVTVQQLTAANIDSPPQNQTICVGGSATFSVTASGSSPLSYQWRKNVADIPGATGSSYTIANVRFSDANAYSVLVSNACGAALSAAATLTVIPVSTLTLSSPQADCVHGRFYVRLNRTFVLAEVRDPNHYLVRWQDGAMTGALPVATVQSTVVGGTVTDVTLVAGGALPPETATYNIEVSGLPGDCGVPMATVSIPAPCDPILRGRVFRDDPSLFQNDVCTQSAELDNNSLFDEVLREYGLPGHTVIAQSTVNPNIEIAAVTDAHGDFRISVPPGGYTVRLAPKPNWEQACPESNGAYPVTAAAPGVDQLNFSRHSTTSFRDLRVSVNGYAAKTDHTPDTRRTPCCGQDAVFIINYRNTGTMPVTDGTVSLSLPLAVVPPAPASAILKPNGGTESAAVAVGSDSWSWYLPTVIPGGSGQIHVRVHLNCAENSLVELPAIAAVSDYLDDPSQDNNIARRSVFTRCSLDTSDLTVSPTGCGATGLVPVGTEFLYTIVFQNVGTGPAFDVVVENSLPPALDPATMDMVNWSHDFVLGTIGNTLQWSMPDVALPPGDEGSADSQGFLTFKVRALGNAALGLPIRNSASIYLDLNPPVITARTTNTLSNTALPIAAFSQSKIAVRPGQPVDFTYTGGTADATFLWEFGPDATPSTATTPNPAGVVFADLGRRTVTLTVSLGDCASSAAQSLLVAEPRITITRRGAPPGRARLLWPLPDFRLQTTGELPPVQWTDLPDASGVVVPTSEPQKFYQLVNP